MSTTESSDRSDESFWETALGRIVIGVVTGLVVARMVNHKREERTER